MTSYPARKEPVPMARLRPSNYPAKRCRVVSGRLRLVITIATKNQVNPSADTRFAVTGATLRLLSSHDVPFPGAASLRADAPGHGLSMRMSAAFSPALPRGYRHPSGPGCAPPFRPPGTRARPPPGGLPSCLRGAPDDRFAATGTPLRHFVLFFCPVPADFAALRLPVLGRCGRLRDRINPRTLRSPAPWWPACRLSPPSSETGGRVQSASFRSP